MGRGSDGLFAEDSEASMHPRRKRQCAGRTVRLPGGGSVWMARASKVLALARRPGRCCRGIIRMSWQRWSIGSVVNPYKLKIPRQTLK